MKKISLIAGTGAFLVMSIVTPTFAQTATSTGPKSRVDAVCMQSAIAKKEAAINSAFSAYASSVSAALTARAGALNSAWGLTNTKDRNAAIKALWKTYRSAISSARSTWSKARQSAWNSFYSARKSCGPGAAAEDSTTHSVDASL